MLLGMLDLSSTHTACPVIVQTRSFDTRSGLIRPPGVSSLILFGMFSIGAEYASIVRQTSGYALGIGAVTEGRVGCAEAMWHEEVFFVTFVVFFVSMIVLRKKKGNIGRRAEACIEENGYTPQSMKRWEEWPGRPHRYD